MRDDDVDSDCDNDSADEIRVIDNDDDDVA